MELAAAVGDWALRWAADSWVWIAVEVAMGVRPLRREPGWSLELFLYCGGLVPVVLLLLAGLGDEESGWWLIDTARTLGQLRPSGMS